MSLCKYHIFDTLSTHIWVFINTLTNNQLERVTKKEFETSLCKHVCYKGHANIMQQKQSLIRILLPVLSFFREYKKAIVKVLISIDHGTFSSPYFHTLIYFPPHSYVFPHHHSYSSSLSSSFYSSSASTCSHHSCYGGCHYWAYIIFTST